MSKRVAFILVALSIAISADARTWRTERYKIDSHSVDTVEIEHAVGELTIEAGDSQMIEIVMTVECSSWSKKCEARTEQVELSSRTAGGTLELRIKGFPKTADSLSVNLEIRMPRRLSLDIDHGVGETTIRGVEGDISVESGVGEVSVKGPVEAFGEVDAECGVGEADLSVPGGHIEREGFLFLGNELKWSGSGESVIEVEIGVGSLEIELY